MHGCNTLAVVDGRIQPETVQTDILLAGSSCIMDETALAALQGGWFGQCH